MSLTKFCVFSVILVSTCGVIKSQIHPTAILIDTRFKRESEMDYRSRGHKILPKLSLGILGNLNHNKPNINPIATTAKALNSLNIKINNIVPRKNIVSLATKPMNLKNAPRDNIEEISNVPVKSTHQSKNTDKINDIESSTIRNSSEKSILDRDTTIYDKVNNVQKETQKPVMPVAPKAVFKEVMKNNTPLFFEEESVNVLSEKIRYRATNDTEVDSDVSYPKLLSRATTNSIIKNGTNISHGENEPEIVEDILKKETNQTRKLTESNSIKNDVTKIPAPELGAKVSIGINPLSILKTLPVLTEGTKLLLPKINQVQSHLTKKPRILEENPDMKVIHEDSAIITQDHIIFENKNKTKDIKMTSLLLKPPGIEPNEEIIIQNNNYEEIYESPDSPQSEAPQYSTSEFRNIQNSNSFHPIPSTPCEAYETNINYPELNNPYSYDIQRYPDSYVVSTYDGLTNRNYNYCNNSSDSTNNCESNQGNNFNQPRISNWFNNQNNYLRNGHKYPRISRTWNTNNIIVRPRSAKTANSDKLYNNINGYIANSRNIKTSNSAKHVRLNQNILPCTCTDPIWFKRRYGY